MPQQEKQAWFVLSVVAITLGAYLAFTLAVRFDPSSARVFALSALLGLPFFKHRGQEITYDERDRRIARQALLLSLRVLLVLVVLLPLATGYARGWTTSIPLWVVIQAVWASALTIWGVKALVMVALYHRGTND